MTRKILIFLIASAAILIGILVFGGLRSGEGNNSAIQLDDFAKCLADKGAVVYGTPWCSWCQKQKTDFKDAWQFIKYVDCSENPNDCIALGIEATPIWIFPDGRKIAGYQNLEKLSRETGCELPSGF